MAAYFIGVDVGTSSVRAGIFTDKGKLVQCFQKELTIYKYDSVYYEQSSTEIWKACCEVIKEVSANVDCKSILGIAFDATCSLVVLDKEFNPVSVNKEGVQCRNIIMWLDHRANKEADEINAYNHDVLKYVGGEMSLEMQPGKLLWLKKNLSRSWKEAYYFFDLPDFLTFKATGSTARSVCSITCKWTYSVSHQWTKSFWTQIGLNELTQNTFERIGNKVVNIGESVGDGISQRASLETCLKEGTCVAASMIDAHCGGVGTIGCNTKGYNLPCDDTLNANRIAIISGTSSCHMAISKTALFVDGVWGPYESAMLPKYWLSEGGQSSVGNLLEYVVKSHPSYSKLKQTAKEGDLHMFEYLNQYLVDLAKQKNVVVEHLSTNIHVLPDYHGNRSPLANPTICGMISGITLDDSLENLALIYLATLQSLANGTKHILDALVKSGHSINTIFMTGGLIKNKLFVQCHADATGRPVVLGKEKETVLLGGAVLSACASKYFSSIERSMMSMCRVGEVVPPNGNVQKFYALKYKVFIAMYQHQDEYTNIMKTL